MLARMPYNPTHPHTHTNSSGHPPCAHVQPHQCIVQWLAGGAAPHQCRLPLVGDAQATHTQGAMRGGGGLHGGGCEVHAWGKVVKCMHAWRCDITCAYMDDMHARSSPYGMHAVVSMHTPGCTRVCVCVPSCMCTPTPTCRAMTSLWHFPTPVVPLRCTPEHPSISQGGHAPPSCMAWSRQGMAYAGGIAHGVWEHIGAHEQVGTHCSYANV